MFEKSIKCFQSDADTQKGLTRYMLKSLGAELLGELIKYVCQESPVSVSIPAEASNITPEVKMRELA